MDKIWMFNGYFWDNNPNYLVLYPNKNTIINKNGTKMGLTLGWLGHSFGVKLRNHLDER